MTPQRSRREKNVLPKPKPEFTGVITPSAREGSRPEKPKMTYPPEGAPNIVIVLLDGVGFAASDLFGGPVPMPALRTVAEAGLRYNQFHTTALCSPTRAALLTGRNAHSVGMGVTTDGAVGYPGYDSIIPNSKATTAEVLRGNDYNTAWFGKNHCTPVWEQGLAGPFDRWPTGLGFERFYGFMGGEASQYEPLMVDQTTPLHPHEGRENYHMTEDLTDRTIAWLPTQKASAPNKPFYIYYAPGAAHAPHHAPAKWIEKFRGQFDQAWDRLREEIYQRQLALGVIPPDTQNTPRRPEIPAWDEYPDEYRPVAARLMECYAGFLAHTDYHVGRLIDTLKEMGQWENTLFIYIVGDNGASAEGTVHGTWSLPAMQNGFPDDPDFLVAKLDTFGTADAENHYNVGWAWALDCPLQWTKQVASHFGGTRNAMALCWPERIKARGELRSQFHHVIDIAPTIFELTGIEPPTHVNGVAQEPLEGVSMAYTFDQPEAKSTHTPQYFEIMANRGIYHKGWMASCFHGRVPWIRTMDPPVFGEQEIWELYHVDEDFAQAEDLAATHPEKLKELLEIFDREAWKYSVYPLGAAAYVRGLPPINRPSLLEGTRNFTYYADTLRLPEYACVNVKNVSFEITAKLVIPKGGAEGVVVCQGGHFGGWSLYVADNRPVYVHNWFGHEMYTVASETPLPAGEIELKLVFDYDGGGMGLGGDAAILVNGARAAEGRIAKTVPVAFSQAGETFDVGVDTGSPVGDYQHGFAFTGEIKRVDIAVGSMGEGFTEEQKAQYAEMYANAIAASQ